MELYSCAHSSLKELQAERQVIWCCPEYAGVCLESAVEELVG